MDRVITGVVKAYLWEILVCAQDTTVNDRELKLVKSTFSCDYLVTLLDRPLWRPAARHG